MDCIILIVHSRDIYSSRFVLANLGHASAARKIFKPVLTMHGQEPPCTCMMLRDMKIFANVQIRSTTVACTFTFASRLFLLWSGRKQLELNLLLHGSFVLKVNMIFFLLLVYAGLVEILLLLFL